jgi:sRNA-binding protein
MDEHDLYLERVVSQHLSPLERLGEDFDLSEEQARACVRAYARMKRGWSGFRARTRGADGTCACAQVTEMIRVLSNEIQASARGTSWA